MPALALMLLLLGCAHAAAPRLRPPPQAWPFCDYTCDQQDAVSLGVLMSEDKAEFTCACALKPAAT